MAWKYFNFIEGMQRKDGSFDNYKNFQGELTAQNQEVNLKDLISLDSFAVVLREQRGSAP